MKHLNLKKTTLFLISITIASCLSAQNTLSADTTKPWNIGGLTSITFSQLSFNNWATGGDNSLTGLFTLNLFSNYSNDKLSWENTLDLNMGMIKQGSNQAKKSDDRFEIASKFGYRASKKWLYSALLSFRTQFFDGYDPAVTDSSVLISRGLMISMVTLFIIQAISKV